MVVLSTIGILGVLLLRALKEKQSLRRLAAWLGCEISLIPLVPKVKGMLTSLCLKVLALSSRFATRLLFPADTSVLRGVLVVALRNSPLPLRAPLLSSHDRISLNHCAYGKVVHSRDAGWISPGWFWLTVYMYRSMSTWKLGGVKR